jgi:CRP/FNR family transcriptional regulator, cyclic AMP receptor protein
MPPPNDALGWIASGLVFSAFCAREMLALRLLAIVSNVAFISYGYSGHLWPIMFLHAAMLPMNIIRLRQLVLGSRKHPSTAASSLPQAARFCLTGVEAGQPVTAATCCPLP